MVSGIGPSPAFARMDFAAAQRVGVSEPVSESGSAAKSTPQNLSREDEDTVRALKQRDDEVRAHEHAHATAGGELAGSPSYQFTSGPDGKRYATGGEVKIDSSPVRGNPEATIRKMDVVIRAALAPANPSSQDLQVARQAQQARTQAQAELVEQRQAKEHGDNAGAASAQPPGSVTTPDAARQLQARNAYDAPESVGEKDLAVQLFDPANSISFFA